MLREVEEHLTYAPTRDAVLREQREARLRVNPRSGDTTFGLLCYVCAADLVQAGASDAGYACKRCRAVDSVIGRVIGAPLLTPDLFDEEEVEWTDDDVIDDTWFLDPSAVVENRDMRVFTTSAMNFADKRPDVSMSEWAEWSRPSLITSAQAYILLLTQELPDVFHLHPELSEPTWIVDQIH